MPDLDTTPSFTASNTPVGRRFLTSVEEEFKRLLGHRITIDQPLAGDVLHPERPFQDGALYRVSGGLHHLDPQHKVRLAVENAATGEFWPQGHEDIELDALGRWSGLVYIASEQQAARLYALIAPPTTVEFWDYYRRAGSRSGVWAPLMSLPCEVTEAAVMDLVVHPEDATPASITQ
jgi:hypothetical protein